jgi:hypothetical protein
MKQVEAIAQEATTKKTIGDCKSFEVGKDRGKAPAFYQGRWGAFVSHNSEGRSSLHAHLFRQ